MRLALCVRVQVEDFAKVWIGQYYLLMVFTSSNDLSSIGTHWNGRLLDVSAVSNTSL